jgi:hypothetical protein
MLETDFVHDTAVAVALGLAAELDLMDAEFTRAGSEPSSAEFLPLLELLQLRDVEATRRHTLVEQWARGFDAHRAFSLDAPFSLRSAASEQMALAWIEHDCLMILQGNVRGLERLSRAVSSADLLFAGPRWISGAWRAPATAKRREPTLEDVRELLCAVQEARAGAAAAQP